MLHVHHFQRSGRKRGTSILEASHPAGPFTPLVNRAATPANMMALDGILYIDEKGAPWLVYCHEWLEVTDGRILAQRLAPDLKAVKGKPVELLRAGTAPWAGPIKSQGIEGYVTDAPFFHRTKNGELLMLWSSFTKNGKYAIGVARSASGQLHGPWRHDPEPLNTDDGGHSMLFRDFNGQLRISYHAPNTAPDTRVRIYSVEEHNGKLNIIQ
ncbi:family 43 glycosylhydrolase [Chitinophaga pollutisoli]|uniref:Family 43 glycosylhydrolase n=1 Tax=Chitinophaga pollutisoli TaxID=3133966 RepID=A0ABZ2YVY0_9BACT